MYAECLDTTFDLVDRSRDGDARARNQLIARYLPLLTRWPLPPSPAPTPSPASPNATTSSPPTSSA